MESKVRKFCITQGFTLGVKGLRQMFYEIRGWGWFQNPGRKKTADNKFFTDYLTRVSVYESIFNTLDINNNFLILQLRYNEKK